MTAEIEGVIRALLTEEFKVEPDAIRADASFKELGLDSLDVVSFVMALEDRLGLEIPEHDLEGVNTFGAALALLQRKAATRA